MDGPSNVSFKMRLILFYDLCGARPCVESVHARWFAYASCSFVTMYDDGSSGRSFTSPDIKSLKKLFKPFSSEYASLSCRLMPALSQFPVCKKDTINALWSSGRASNSARISLSDNP